MNKKNQKSNNYLSRISKSNEEIALEQQELTVEQAELNFAQGVLSLKGKLLTAEGEVKKAESAVKNAEVALENAKSSKPERLVQNIVDAKQALTQCKLDLESATEAYTELNSMYEFLEETKAELFDK